MQRTAKEHFLQGNISQPDYEVRNECEYITTRRAMKNNSIGFRAAIILMGSCRAAINSMRFRGAIILSGSGLL